MKTKIFFIAGLAALVSTATLADTLELADGRLLEGDYVGSSNGIIMFDTGAGIEAFPESEVIGVFFSAGVETAEKYLAESGSNSIVVPAGTRLVIRTSDSLDSRRHSAGHRFRGQLEGALVVGGVTAAPRGAVVHGRLTRASQSGRIAGSSELGIEFTDLVIDDVLVPIRTGEMAARTESEGGRSLGRTARGAAVGGLFGGSSGARSGARIGAAASILGSGESLSIPRGTLLDTTLSEALTIRQ